MGTKSQLNVPKNDVVTHLFVDTADQDYILARMSYHGQMVNGFFWAAGQAIERYLKASLLLNGKSSKGYNHDLVKLFEAVNQYASDLFPERLTKPPQLRTALWHKEETPVEFLKRIKPYTDPNSRYNIFGYILSPEDLFHLDQFIFAARRVAFRLDYTFSRQPKNRQGVPQKTVREMMVRSPKYEPRKSLLDKIKKANSNHKLYDAALSFNFPFAPDDYEHKQIQLSSSEASPVLDRHIFALLRQEPKSSHTDAADLAADLADWVVENISLPKELKQKLRNASTCLRTRASKSSSS